MHEPSNARDVESLIDAVRSASRTKYLYFWGHTPRSKTIIDQSCLSQWYPAPFSVGGTLYATSEHYMMAMKAALFGDETCHRRILAAKSPGEAKVLGRKVGDFVEELWVARRWEVAVEGNQAKFETYHRLREYLLGTGKRVLVEASPRDRIWGIGMERKDAERVTPADWSGLNLLGFALMEVRSRVRGAT